MSWTPRSQLTWRIGSEHPDVPGGVSAVEGHLPSVLLTGYVGLPTLPDDEFPSVHPITLLVQLGSVEMFGRDRRTVTAIGGLMSVVDLLVKVTCCEVNVMYFPCGVVFNLRRNLDCMHFRSYV